MHVAIITSSLPAVTRPFITRHELLYIHLCSRFHDNVIHFMLSSDEGGTALAKHHFKVKIRERTIIVNPCNR